MEYQEIQQRITTLKSELNTLSENDFNLYTNIKKEISTLQHQASLVITPWDRVCLAREVTRPRAMEYIRNLFDDFIELHGDYLFADDEAVVTGIAMLDKYPITVIAQAKGKTLNDNIKRNFGSANPEGFRKAKRIALEAEKFNRPIITIVDTSGAYPGRGAEERGQARAIAEDIMLFSSLSVPVFTIVIGEGGSGGALALSVANKIYMLENAIYSILSPEGFASILYKDPSKYKESANKMGLTSFDLYEKGIVDEIIYEGDAGINDNFKTIIKTIKDKLISDIKAYKKLDGNKIKEMRYQKFRKIGSNI